MRRNQGLRVLIGLNVALACCLGVTLLSRTHAIAQEEGRVTNSRLRGEYTMITARTNAGGPHAVWVLDAANAEMVALKWDQSRQSLIGAGYREVTSDLRVSPGR
jgi:hypothetical protein